MSIIETSKDIYELVKRGATIDLQQRLLQLREEAMSLQEENLLLTQRIQDLEEQLRISTELEYDGSLYWIKKSDTENEGPYCQRCYDSDRKLIRLQSGGGRPNTYEWTCLGCDKHYGRRMPLNLPHRNI